MRVGARGPAGVYTDKEVTAERQRQTFPRIRHSLSRHALFPLQPLYCRIVRDRRYSGGLRKQSLIKGNEQTASELSFRRRRPLPETAGRNESHVGY